MNEREKKTDIEKLMKINLKMSELNAKAAGYYKICETARKKSRRAKILSIIALTISVTALLMQLAILLNRLGLI